MLADGPHDNGHKPVEITTFRITGADKIVFVLWPHFGTTFFAPADPTSLERATPTVSGSSHNGMD